MTSRITYAALCRPLPKVIPLDTIPAEVRDELSDPIGTYATVTDYLNALVHALEGTAYASVDAAQTGPDEWPIDGQRRCYFGGEAHRTLALMGEYRRVVEAVIAAEGGPAN